MRKVSNLDIASSGKLVRPAGHEDLIWLDPSQVIIVGEESEYRATGSRIPFASSLFSGSHDFPAKAKAVVVTESSDVPELSDIENVEYTKYFDPVSKIEKAKVIIKIRNSSKNKNNVAGVDARIYQPRGL